MITAVLFDLDDTLFDHRACARDALAAVGPDTDVVWLEQAGRAGWVALTKDDAIRRRPVELQALAANGVRAFCLTNANLTGEQQRDRFLANINRMIQRSRRPGPWICAVHERQLVQIWPRRGSQKPQR